MAETGMGGWNPIETAPRDGTSVDLWVVEVISGEGCRVPDVRWTKHKEGYGTAEKDAEGWWDRRGGYGDGGWVESDGDYTASHWMPLPNPPEAENG